MLDILKGIDYNNNIKRKTNTEGKKKNEENCNSNDGSYNGCYVR